MRRKRSTLLFMLILFAVNALPALAHDIENAPPPTDIEWLVSAFGVLVIALALLSMLIKTVIDLRHHNEKET